MAENLNLSTRVGMNTAPLVKAVGTAKQQLRSLNKDLKQQKSAFRDVGMGSKELASREKMLTNAIKQQSSYLKQKRADYDKVKASIKDMNNMTSKEVSALNKARNAVSKEEYALRGYKNELSRVKTEQIQLNSSTSKLTSKIKQNEINTKRVASYWRQLGKEGKALKAEYQGLSAQTSKYSAAVSREESNLKKLRGTYSANSSVIKQQEQKIAGLRTQQSKLITSQEKARIAMQKAGNTASAASNKVQRLGTRYKEAGRSMMSVGRSMAASISLPVSLAIGGAIKSTVEWEDALSNVAKTTNASESQMAKYGDSIRNMARSMPESQSTLANTMATAAQLGIKGGKSLEKFTKVATQMGVATDMSAEEASQAMAKFANATGKPDSDFNKLGSTVVQLGNNMAAQEGDIMNFAQRLAGSATVAGVSQKDIIALSSAMASVGINAEAGGSSMSKILTKMNNAVQDGGEKLSQFAAASGMSASEFSAQWEKDPYKALQAFEEGLNKQNKSGENVNDTLKQLGITELRERDTVLRLANGNEQLGKARKNADKGFKEGIALNQEAETKYKTLGNQMKIFMNNLRDLGISIGGALAPMIKLIMKGLTPLIQLISHAPAPIRAMIGIFGVLAAAAGPVIIGLGAITAALGAIQGSAAIMGVLGGIKTAFLAIGGVLTAVSAPVWIAIGAITALGAAFIIAYKKSETFRNIVNGALKAIGNAFVWLWGMIKTIGASIGSFVMNYIINPIVTGFTALTSGIKTAGGAIGNFVMNYIVSPIQTAAQFVIGGFQTIGSAIANFVNGSIFGPIKAFGESLMNTIRTFWDKNGSMIMQALTNISNFITTVFTSVVSVVKSILSGLGTAFSWAFNTMIQISQTVGSALLSVLVPAFQFLVNTIKPVLSSLGNFFRTVFVGMIQVATSVFQGLWGVLQPILQMFGQMFISFWNFIKLTFQNIWNTFKGVVQGALTAILGFVQIFGALFTGNWSALWSGIKQVFSGVMQVIKTIFMGLWTNIMNVIGFFGSIVKAAWFGLWGALKGIVTGVLGVIVSFVRSSFNNIVAFLNYIWTIIKATAQIAWNGIKLVILNPIRAVYNWFKVALPAMKTLFIVIWSAIKTSVMTLVRTMATVVKAIIAGMRATIVAIFNAIRTFAVAVWSAIKNRVVTLARLLWTGVKAAFNALKNSITVVFNAVRSFIYAVWTAIKNRVVALARSLWHLVISAFNALKAGITRIFNAVRSFIYAVWNAIKNRVVALARNLKNLVISAFNALSSGVRRIFNAVKNFAISVWTNIKNRVVSLARSLWHLVVNVFNSLKSRTTAIFNAVRSFLVKLWTNVKNRVVSLARGLRSLVVGVWNGLKSSTTKIFNTVKNFMVNAWTTIKNKVTGMATGLKNGVLGTFNKMKSGMSNVIDKIKGFVQGMIDKVKGGLNKLIKGVNWVGSKLGMGKIPEVKMSTGTEHTNRTKNLVTNGTLNRDTFATVGDKGKGNGPGGFRHETVIPPKGKAFITPSKDTTMPMSKGTKILNGSQTHSMLSSGFSTGTIPKFKKGTDNKKKDKGFWANAGDAVAGFGKGAAKKVHGVSTAAAKKVGEGVGKGTSFAKSAGKAIAGATAKGTKWLGSKVKDVMDFVKNPGKLLDYIIKAFGVNFDGLGKDNLPADMMGGMFTKLKDAAKNLIKQWLEETEEGSGDASWLFKHPIWQKFGSYTGGLNFNGGKHYGIDFGMPIGTPVKAVADGKVSKVWNDYGGGNSVEVQVGKGLWNWYMHLSKIMAKKGQKVSAGDVIGKSGDTGNFVRGAHLHFQLNKGDHSGNDTAINPMSWLKNLSSGGKNKAASKWSPDIKKAAKAMKVNLSNKELKGIIAQIQRESNGNAGVTQGNIGDINNKRGTPAQGLLQYVPSTFKAYAKKGHTNIKSGYDQLLAFFNNSNWRKDLPYGKSGWGPSGRRRFATGTNLAPRGWAQVHEKGGEIMNLRGGEQIIPHDVSIKALSNLLSSELFNKTQSAVYQGISTYADELRKQEVEKRKQQKNERNNQSNNDDIAEMKSMFNDMLYLMQKMVGASEETAQNTNGLLNKKDSKSNESNYDKLSKQLGFDYVMSNYNSGSHV